MQARTLLSLVILTTTGCALEPTESTATQDVEGAPPHPENLVLWLDPTRGVGLSPEGQVIWWEDQSGHGHIMARGNPDTPSVSFGKFPHSDYNGVLFTPAGPHNVLAGGAGYLVNSDVQLKPPFTVAMAIYPIANHEGVPFTGSTAPTVTIGGHVEYSFGTIHAPGDDISDDVQLRATSGATPDFGALPISRAGANGSHVAIAMYNGPTSQFRVDEAIRHGSLPYANLTGAALSNAGRSFSGYIGEVLIYRGTLDYGDEAALAAYLRARFP